MKTVTDNYNEYLVSREETWRRRFTWGGIGGKTPKHTTSISRFNVETGAFKDMKDVYDTTELFKSVAELAEKYVNWVRTKGKGYTEREYKDMYNFFIGAIGEYFFSCLFEDVKCITTPMDSSGEFVRLDFNCTSPTLKDDIDLGVDFTGFVNDMPAVIQVKFWNPFGKKGIKIETIQKAYAEGVSRGLIDKDGENNVVICFLGSEKTVYDNLKRTPGYKPNTIVIGRGALAYSIDNRNRIFWNSFKKNLENLK